MLKQSRPVAKSAASNESLHSAFDDENNEEIKEQDKAWREEHKLKGMALEDYCFQPMPNVWWSSKIHFCQTHKDDRHVEERMSCSQTLCINQ